MLLSRGRYYWQNRNRRQINGGTTGANNFFWKLRLENEYTVELNTTFSIHVIDVDLLSTPIFASTNASPCPHAAARQIVSMDCLW